MAAFRLMATGCPLAARAPSIACQLTKEARSDRGSRPRPSSDPSSARDDSTSGRCPRTRSCHTPWVWSTRGHLVRAREQSRPTGRAAGGCHRLRRTAAGPGQSDPPRSRRGAPRPGRSQRLALPRRRRGRRTATTPRDGWAAHVRDRCSGELDREQAGAGGCRATRSAAVAAARVDAAARHQPAIARLPRGRSGPRSGTRRSVRSSRALDDCRLELIFEDDPPYLLAGEWVPYLTVIITAVLADALRSRRGGLDSPDRLSPIGPTAHPRPRPRPTPT